MKLFLPHDGDVIATRIGSEVGVDKGLQHSQSLALRMDHGVVQNPSQNLQAAVGGCLGDAVSGCDHVVVVQDGTGANVVGLSEEAPLDQADLGELSGQSVYSADDPARD